jgi:hypothetical protein
MGFDLSSLKNIDFSSTNNLLFLLIIFVLVAIVFFVFYTIIRFIIRLFVSVSKSIFYRRKSEIDYGEDLNVYVKELEQSKDGRLMVEEKQPAAVSTGGPKLDYASHPAVTGNKEPEKSDKQKYEEKEKKGVVDGLAKLKSAGPDGQGTLESKMPSREADEPEDDIYKKIKIPVAKKFDNQPAVMTDPGKPGPVINTQPVKKADLKISGAKESPLKLLKKKILSERNDWQAELNYVLEQKVNLENEQKKIELKLKGSVDFSERKSLEQLELDLAKKKQDIEKRKSEAEVRIKNLNSQATQIDESLEKGDNVKKRFQEGEKFADKGFVGWVTKMIRRDKKVKELEEKLKSESVVISSDLHGSKLTYEKKQIERAQKALKEKNKGWFGGQKDSTDSNGVSKPGDMYNTRSKKIYESLLGGAKREAVAQKDSSIFGGKSEISRSELREKLEDPRLGKVERGFGLNLSAVQRANLEKEVFSSSLGGNISRSDLKQGIKKLNEKLANTKNSTEHAKLRREVKFIKRIGGIK